MGLNAYCSECDKQVEIVKSHVVIKENESKKEVYLECPWCYELELVVRV